MALIYAIREILLREVKQRLIRVTLHIILSLPIKYVQRASAYNSVY